MEWIATPQQRLDGIRRTLLAAPRPCDCPDCPQMRTWRAFTDGALDAMLAEQELIEALKVRAQR